jgi:hypothetical protein
MESPIVDRPRRSRLTSPVHRAARGAARLVAAVLAALSIAGAAAAHGVGMSTLQLHVDGTHVTGEWDVHIRDARWAVGLEPTVGGAEGFVGLRTREDSLRAVLRRSLALAGDGEGCPLTVTAAPMEWHPDFSYVRLHLAAECPTPPRRLRMRIDFMFDRDATHRAYFSVEDARVVSVGVLHANQREVSFDIRQFHVLPIVGEFVAEGIGHIWSGIDHVLFLLALLLPASLLRDGNQWSPRPGFGATLRDVLKVVTAFTVAHSITLCLTFFGVIVLPSQWVEVGIALSVFAAAWNNLRPFLPGRAWVIAGLFGFVHGMGFAGALRNLSLPRHARGLALGAFNGGVEIGQIAIVLVALPLLYLASRRSVYTKLVMGVGSLGIAWVAIMWVIERGFNITLFAR